VLSVLLFFVLGALVLIRVDVAAGEAQARVNQATNPLTERQPPRHASGLL
jgi:hypothetical protein